MLYEGLVWKISTGGASPLKKILKVSKISFYTLLEVKKQPHANYIIDLCKSVFWDTLPWTTNIVYYGAPIVIQGKDLELCAVIDIANKNKECDSPTIIPDHGYGRD